MNKNIKLGYTKSKAYGLCGVILTAALMMVMAPRAYADEATTTTPATETVATVETPAETPATTEATTTTEAATAETPATATTETPATTEATTAEQGSLETPTISTGATEITKEGDTITVKNPDVDMHFTKSADGNGTGKYVNFKVEYKDIKFPDSLAINQGDKVVFHMPEEVSFRTNFDFDVMNHDNQVVGHAQTDMEKGTVTTTFNDVFTKNPLNKQMSMIFDAKWTEAVTSGKEATPNFDGTVKKVLVDPEPELDPTTEKFSKWGSQAPEDPQIMRWTFRLNLAKQTLENLIIKDRWSADQEFVEGSLEPFFVDDVKTWSNYTSAKEYLDSFHLQNGGFDLKMKKFDRILYVNYRTKLTTPVKESNDPVNAVWVTDGAGNPLANNYRAHVALAGGKGRASSENIPTPEPEPKPEPKPEPTPAPQKETVHVVEAGERELPHTGTAASLALTALGALGLAGAVYMKRRTND